jgi:hypothetical protein
MRVIPADKAPGAAHGAARLRSFWQRLARTLDDYLAERTKRAVRDATFRRSRHEIDRCRRLMLKGPLAPAHGLTHARIAYASPHRAASVGRPSR